VRVDVGRIWSLPLWLTSQSSRDDLLVQGGVTLLDASSRELVNASQFKLSASQASLRSAASPTARFARALTGAKSAPVMVSGHGSSFPLSATVLQRSGGSAAGTS